MITQIYIQAVLSDARVHYHMPELAASINEGLTADNVMRLACLCKGLYYTCDWLVKPERLYAYALGLEAVAYRMGWDS